MAQDDTRSQLRRLEEQIADMRRQLAKNSEDHSILTVERDSARVQYRDLEEYTRQLESRLQVLKQQDQSQVARYYKFVNQNYEMAMKILASQNTREHYEFSRQNVVLVYQLLISLKRVIDYQQVKFSSTAVVELARVESEYWRTNAGEDAKKYAEEVSYLKAQILALNDHLATFSLDDGPDLPTKHSLTVGDERELVETQYEDIRRRFATQQQYVQQLQSECAAKNVEIGQLIESLEEARKAAKERAEEVQELLHANDELTAQMATLRGLAQQGVGTAFGAVHTAMEPHEIVNSATLLEARTPEANQDTTRPAPCDPVETTSPDTAHLSRTQNVQRELNDLQLCAPVLIPPVRYRTRQFQTEPLPSDVDCIQTDHQRIFRDSDGKFILGGRKVWLQGGCFADADGDVANFNGIAQFAGCQFAVTRGIVSGAGKVLSQTTAEISTLRSEISVLEVQNEGLIQQVRDLERLVARLSQQHPEVHDVANQSDYSTINGNLRHSDTNNADLPRNIHLFCQERQQLERELHEMNRENLRAPEQIQRLQRLATAQARVITELSERLSAGRISSDSDGILFNRTRQRE